MWHSATCVMWKVGSQWKQGLCRQSKPARGLGVWVSKTFRDASILQLISYIFYPLVPDSCEAWRPGAGWDFRVEIGPWGFDSGSGSLACLYLPAGKCMSLIPWGGWVPVSPLSMDPFKHIVEGVRREDSNWEYLMREERGNRQLQTHILTALCF